MKINYIPAFYCGPRMNTSYTDSLSKNATYLFSKQVDALNRFGEGIDLVTFVFNLDNLEEKTRLEEYIRKKFTMNFNFELVFRENRGASYGAWNDVVKKNLNEFDYFFITEDDFVPVATNFYKPFIDRCVKKVAYVSMFAAKEFPQGYPHASIPHGVVDANACRDVLNNQGELFRVYTQDNTYNTFYKTQQDFYEFFIKQGYLIDDITDAYLSPFMNSPTKTITYFGDRNNPVLMEPVPLP